MRTPFAWLPVCAAAALLALVAACGGEEEVEAPSSEQARELLVEMVALANSGEWEALCSMAGSSQPEPSCMRAVEELGPSPPSFEIEVLDERVHPARKDTRPSRVLHVCVYIDRDPVETEVSFVTERGGRIDVQWPAFWEQRWYTDDTSGIIAPKPTPRPGEETLSPCEPR
ncbi:MAG: hypothetical protein Kow0010_17940 [Dehalococcoidia bacterium]